MHPRTPGRAARDEAYLVHLLGAASRRLVLDLLLPGDLLVAGLDLVVIVEGNSRLFRFRLRLRINSLLNWDSSQSILLLTVSIGTRPPVSLLFEFRPHFRPVFFSLH